MKFYFLLLFFSNFYYEIFQLRLRIAAKLSAAICGIGSYSADQTTTVYCQWMFAIVRRYRRVC